MTDGGSKIKFLESILKSKAKISMIFVVFNYGINLDFFEFKRKKIKLLYLATWQDVLHEYSNSNKISFKDKNKIENFLISVGVKNLKSSP